MLDSIAGVTLSFLRILMNLYKTAAAIHSGGCINVESRDG
jgi:hypothetical protein